MNTKFIYQALNDCQNRNGLTAVFICDNFEEFSLGYVQAVTDYDVLLALRSPEGRLDGYEVLPLELICKIETETEESKVAKVLGDQYDPKNPSFYFENGTPKRKSCLFDIVVCNLIEDSKIMRMQIQGGEDVIVGIIQEDQNDGLKIQSISDYGSRDGFIWIKKEYITGIRFDGHIEQELEKKWKSQS